MKNIKIIVFISMIFALESYSQSASSIDVSFGIVNSYRSISNSSGGHLGNMLIEAYDDRDHSKANWDATVSYCKTISAKVDLKLGIRYSKFGYYNKKDEIARWPSQSDGNGGFIATSNAGGPFDVFSFFSSSSFIGVPIAIRYNMSSKKIKPYFELGVAPSYHLGTKDITIGDGIVISENTKDYIPSINVFVDIATGLEFQVSEPMQFFGQLHYTHQLNTFEYGIFEENLFAYGFEVGVRRLLNSNSTKQ